MLMHSEADKPEPLEQPEPANTTPTREKQEYDTLLSELQGLKQQRTQEQQSLQTMQTELKELKSSMATLISSVSARLDETMRI